MSLIGLIRHSSTKWNKEGRAQGLSDIPLDEEGLSQAKALAERLSKEEWNTIFSSDLLRARQTAEIIAERIRMANIYFDDRLREMMGGKIEGTTEEERVCLWGSNWRDLELGIEDVDSVSSRGTECIEAVSHKHFGQRVLIVSHGALIGLSLKKLLPNVDTNEHLKNASITTIKKINKHWDCEVYNCTKHLEEQFPRAKLISKPKG